MALKEHITTFLTEEGTLIGNSYSGYNCSKLNRLYLMKDVRRLWEMFSKNEREQALAFLQANSGSLQYAYWFLTTYRNLDTGRTYKAIGCSMAEPGVCLSQFKRYIGVK